MQKISNSISYYYHNVIFCLGVFFLFLLLLQFCFNLVNISLQQILFRIYLMLTLVFFSWLFLKILDRFQKIIQERELFVTLIQKVQHNNNANQNFFLKILVILYSVIQFIRRLFLPSMFFPNGIGEFFYLFTIFAAIFYLFFYNSISGFIILFGLSLNLLNIEVQGERTSNYILTEPNSLFSLEHMRMQKVLKTRGIFCRWVGGKTSLFLGSSGAGATGKAGVVCALIGGGFWTFVELYKHHTMQLAQQNALEKAAERQQNALEKAAERQHDLKRSELDTLEKAAERQQNALEKAAEREHNFKILQSEKEHKLKVAEAERELSREANRRNEFEKTQQLELYRIQLDAWAKNPNKSPMPTFTPNQNN